MQEFLWQAFVTLFVIIDPFAVVPVFVGLTRKNSLEEKRKIALKSSIIATILLLGFAFIGDSLLDAMNISEPAFRIAGGFLLLLAAIEMVVARGSGGGFHAPTQDETKEAIKKEDISVFPIAIPLIAGPGALTSIVVLMRQAETLSTTAQVGVLLILLIILLITYASLLVGDRILSLLGVTGTNVLTRVFGIILAALAVQNMLTGFTIVVKSLIPS
jgi:multiple antibiotic resistance protein